jgi:C-terminal processing protease CtpA/Prc
MIKWFIHKNIFLSSLVIIFLLSTRCSKDPVSEKLIGSNLDSDDIAVSLLGELQISDFVWKGLNEFYYWQEDVAELSDDKLIDQKSYGQYIIENSDAESFFESLKHPEDRFSWIQDDYRVLENTLQGIFASNGVEFGLLRACQNCNELVGFVKYILENSDAENKNIQRGDLFTGVDGTILTASNYRSLLFGDNLTYTLNMASGINGVLSNNGINVDLTKEENFETNPIQVSKSITIENEDSGYSGNIGYLMYNQFVADKSGELNEAFGNFKAEGISDLILDLRYNGGGSVQNCVELASMITGQFTSEIFAEEQWNIKLLKYLRERFGKETLINRFTAQLSNGEPINSLDLNRVFIITTSESASASELLINGLDSYINVFQIGERTVGKNVGSITVYDYVDNEQTKNPEHTYAMQPIVLKISNSDGFADYSDGLLPDTIIEEDIRNLGILGDSNEPLLETVIKIITGSGKINIRKAKMSRALLVKDPLMLQRQQMIVDKKELQSIRSNLKGFSN